MPFAHAVVDPALLPFPCQSMEVILLLEATVCQEEGAALSSFLHCAYYRMNHHLILFVLELELEFYFHLGRWDSISRQQQNRISEPKYVCLDGVEKRRKKVVISIAFHMEMLQCSGNVEDMVRFS